MMRQNKLGIRLAGAAAAAALALGFQACDGLFDGAEGFCRGRITATGSIIVNGVLFSTDSGEVRIDDGAAAPEDLSAGMVVDLQGLIDRNDPSDPEGIATSIEYDRLLVGPVGLITGTDSVTVLGQLVEVSGDTRYDGLSGILDLVLDDMVEVSGLPQSDGSIAASYVAAAPPDLCEIEGTVSALSGSTDGSFELTPHLDGTPLTVDFTGTLDPAITEGSRVQVSFDEDDYQPLPPAVTSAAAADILPEEDLGPIEGDWVEVEGYVVNLSGSTFSVSRLAVNADGAPMTGIVEGDLVEVEGWYSGGTIYAEDIELQ